VLPTRCPIGSKCLVTLGERLLPISVRLRLPALSSADLGSAKYAGAIAGNRWICRPVAGLPIAAAGG
jgi:hypothetical protein